MSIKIIVDSASDLTKQQAEEMNVTIIPMKTRFGEQEYLDGVDLSHQEFYEKLIETDELPTTSQIAPFSFESEYEKIRAGGDTAVVVTLSSKLSGTYQSACIARQGYEDCVFVVDSKSVTVGEQILVRLGVQKCAEGMAAPEIAEYLTAQAEQITLIAMLDTLEYLQRGGRISKTVAFAGAMLGIKPVVAVVDGAVAVLGKARGSKNVNNILKEQIEKAGGVDFTMPCGLGYTGISDNLLQKYIADSADLWKTQTDALPITHIGSTIGTHVGPGAIAVAFFHR